MVPLVPEGEALRRAVRWLSEQRRHDPAAIAEAARRYDLSPRDEAFLARHFGVEETSGRTPSDDGS